jgi:hypothetical protein
MAVTMKIMVFWDVACNNVDVYRRFGETVTEDAHSPDRLVGLYRTTRCYNPEDVIFIVIAVRTSNPMEQFLF